MSLSVSLEPGTAVHPGHGEPSAPARRTSPATDSASLAASEGALHRFSLRFRDDRLERGYQVRGGAQSLAGFRITTATATVMWLVAAIVVPVGTSIPADRAIPLSLALALLNLAAFLLSPRADTLDRQHSIIAMVTSVNGLVIIWLASTGGLLPGYGISAIMLLFIFGFVARTAFIYALWRSVVIVTGFLVAVLVYDRPGHLLVDCFIFAGAVVGTLVALRRLEQSRRRVYYQDIVITEQADALRSEKGRADALLHDMLPESISHRLLAGERTIADAYPAVTVLFADIVGFTPLAARLAPDAVVAMLDRLFARFDELVTARGLEKIKTIGDAYMAAGGLPAPLDDHAARIVDLGLAMIEVAAQEVDGMAGLRLRVGVHSGPVMGGVIGHRKVAFDIWGETVNIASRLESMGVQGRVHVSEATWQQIRDRFDGESHGPIHIRGYGPMTTYTITGRHAGAMAEDAVDGPQVSRLPRSFLESSLEPRQGELQA